ncbi:MAG TPA: outer membrane beta-barrel protein [Rhizomicrobium sp.]|jgi:opacity protein-like surface antigen|nr:outer membrane beta-barrel protein [Rhizomicrobium sp.]
MKTVFAASAVALALGTSVLSIGAAQADSYVSVLGGPTFDPGLNVNGSKNGMDTGFNVGARYGYYLNDWNLPNVSLEADGLFSQSTYSGTSNARLQSSSYMANAIYHLPTNSPFEIYGGAGIGAIDTNIDNGAGNHGGSTVLGWQALGGVDYRVSDQASIFAEYRYQNAHDVNAGGLTGISNTSNNLSFGVKWRL